MARTKRGRVSPAKPAILRPGDLVAVVSPSWGAAGQYPERLDAGVHALEETLGVRVVVMPHATEVSGWVAGSAEKRASDVNAAFADPGVRAIICLAGGQHVGQILDLLDYDLIAANRKILVGYADMAVLHHAIGARAGLVTFSGPMVLTQWADWTGPDARTTAWFRSAVMSENPIGTITGATSYSDERVSWTKRRSWKRKYYPAPPYSALRAGVASGPAVVTTLSGATALLHSPYAPDYDDCVLFLETPGRGYGPREADRDLTLMRLNGIFEQVAAIVVGRPYHFNDADRVALHELVVQATAGFDFPILADVDIGHTDPQLTLPLGCRVGIDGDQLSILESGVQQTNGPETGVPG